MALFDDDALLAKLRKIEALYAGATSTGERDAARAAADKIKSRLDEREQTEAAILFKCSLADTWSQQLFIALCRRYGLAPFRYRRQRRTTLMVRAPKSFMDETLWPEFEEVSRELRTYLDEVTARVIREAIHADVRDADEVEEPKVLGK